MAGLTKKQRAIQAKTRVVGGYLVTTTPRRSRLMACVRNRMTEPEERVAAALRRQNCRYRRNVRSLPGSPDFANAARGFAILVHGCFWHRHGDCPRTTTPKSNIDFWEAKFRANVERDARKHTELEALGFRVLTIWECETQDAASLEATLKRFLDISVR